MEEVEFKIDFLAEAQGTVGQSSADYQESFFAAFEDALLMPVDFMPGEPEVTIQLITFPDGSTREVETIIRETPPQSFEDVVSGLEINQDAKTACFEDETEYAEDQRAIDELDRQL